MAQALIALGSNLGDRAALLDRAIELLRDASGVTVVRVSRWHETEPVGGPAGQGPYLNGAALLDTVLDPFALARELGRIETVLGRVRNERWGPRTIDLDLLLYDSIRIESPVLTVPHPRMTQRQFVLAPAAEIAADMLHPPSGRSVQDLLVRLERRPRIVATVAELQSVVCGASGERQLIGLVPTMGALHAGHLSLVDSATRECSFVVATVFVNPTQFGPGDDYTRYPRTWEQDFAQLAARGVDVVFAPGPEEMYRPAHATTVSVEGVTARWEGALRPGHFQGVATIVLKLFHAATPDMAFFGQKDYQQLVVVRRMVADLNLPVEIRACPIARDADGLALSSRNIYLSADERLRALSLSQSLRRADELFRSGQCEASVIEREMKAILSGAPVDIDYAAVVEPNTLEPVSRVETGSVALIAARVGATRLIDNHIFE